MCVHLCVCVCMWFARIFALLHNYSNAVKVFEYTTNDFGLVILLCLVNIYIFKAILVIQ